LDTGHFVRLGGLRAFVLHLLGKRPHIPAIPDGTTHSSGGVPVSGPLAGVRVLDFGRFIAAPYCAMVLGDLGAEVLRVERPGGEEDRRLGLEAANGETFTFAALARGKKGITLDLHRGGDAARAVLGDLVRWADVLIHNFGPEAAAALGLTYDEVRAHRP